MRLSGDHNSPECAREDLNPLDLVAISELVSPRQVPWHPPFYLLRTLISEVCQVVARNERIFCAVMSNYPDPG